MVKEPVHPGLDDLLGVLLHFREIGFGGGVFGLVRPLLGDGLDRLPGVSVENAQGQVLGQGDGDGVASQVVDLLPLLVQAELRQHRVPEGLRVGAPELGVLIQSRTVPGFDLVQIQHGLPGVAEHQGAFVQKALGVPAPLIVSVPIPPVLAR